MPECKKLNLFTFKSVFQQPVMQITTQLSQPTEAAPRQLAHPGDYKQKLLDRNIRISTLLRRTKKESALNQVPDPVDCPYYLISRTSLAITAVLKKELTAAGAGDVRVSFLGVLLALWSQDDSKVGDLGRRAGLEPSTMTGVLDRMVRDGLVERKPDPDDRRALRIRLADAGRRIQAPVMAAIDATMDRVMRGVDLAEQEQIKASLRRVLANTDKGEELP